MTIENTVKAIIGELYGRRGFDEWWDSLATEDKREIVEKLEEILAQHDQLMSHPTLRQHLAEARYVYLISALGQCQWDVARACTLAGISQTTLYRGVGAVGKKGRLRRNPPRSTMTGTNILLGYFGVPTDRRGDSLWSLERWILITMLTEAHKGYLAKVRKHHPAAGGSEDDLRKVNDAWGALEKRFKERGVTL